MCLRWLALLFFTNFSVYNFFFFFCFSFSFYIEIVQFLVLGFPLSLLNLLLKNLRDGVLLRSFVSVSHSAVLCLPFKSNVVTAPTYEPLLNFSQLPRHLGICH